MTFGAGPQLTLPPWPTNVPSKLQLNGTWSNVMVKLVMPGSSNPPVKCTVEEILGKQAVYEVVPKPLRPYRNEFVVLAIHNPHTKEDCIISANHTFYVSGKSGLTGYTVTSRGALWLPSYLEMPDANGNLDAAIAKFEKEFDGQKLNNDLLPERRKGASFQRASPQYYYLEKPEAGARAAEMKIEAYEITDEILHVDVRNLATLKPASYWLDLNQRRVVKSIVDGHRMNVASGAPWAEPMD